MFLRRVIYNKVKNDKIKTRVYYLGISFLIIFIFVGGCRRAGLWLVKEDRLQKADGIVILMGSISDRVLQVADLFEQGMAECIFMVEADMGAYKVLEERGVHIISNTSQVRNALLALGIPDENITVLPGDAASTKMEAIILRDYLSARNDITSLIVVSSSPHTRRASMIFRSTFKRVEIQVTFFYSPSAYTGFDAKRWWKSREGVKWVMGEVLKMGGLLGSK